MTRLDPDDPRAPYQQIASKLRAAIDSGGLAPGVQLPTYGALASEYGVSEGTAKNAIAALREAGLVVTRHGKGSYVRTDLPAMSDAALPPRSEINALRADLTRLTQRMSEMERRLERLER